MLLQYRFVGKGYFYRLACLLPLAFAIAAHAQTNTGELRLSVTDSAGLPLKASARIVSEANHYDKTFIAGPKGQVTARRLPFGLYSVNITSKSFAASSQFTDIRSALPKKMSVVLSVARVQTTVNVSDSDTLLDRDNAAPIDHIGSAQIQDRRAALPGRSLLDLVSTQPGWLLEANGVLHPRGSEYQTQYVIDGLPITDNRSPAFVPDFDVNNVQSLSIMTAGYPAEFGRKLGGVVEVTTARDTRQGFHGEAVASGGSFTTADGYMEGQYGWDKNTLTLSASGATTDRYLDPPVLQNYTNHGTTEGFMAHYERDLGDRDRIGFIFRREQARFLVPDEMVQQAAGQRQDRDSFETAGQFSYQHIFSSDVLGDVHAMVRDVTAGFWSNALSTPIVASQNRSYREGYVKGTISIHSGIHEIKTGVEGDFAAVREALNYQITNPSQFDADTPAIFRFNSQAPDREQAVFAQDAISFKNLTLNAGIRFDHYGFLVDRSAWSPRIGVAYYWPAGKIVFRASYDRIFQTPAFENLLVASSPSVASLSGQVLRLPVQPSLGNFYQVGFTKAILGKLRLGANFYRRDFNNYADDDLLLNTGISFPIAFATATIKGAEVKLEVPDWGPFSGFLSYSNMHGIGYFPVTGGLFLGDDTARAATAASGSFPVSQDQRNTVNGRFRYQVRPRLWAALGASYGSGLPVDFNGTYQDAIAQYGQQIVNRVNFLDLRARPGFSLDASVGVIVWAHEKKSVRFQADALNFTNQLNVIDFAGLFSGTALASTRDVNCRLQVEF